MLGGELWIGETPSDVAAEGARRFGEAARRAVEERGRFGVALAGGSTPRALFALLVAGGGGAIAWERVDVFFGDERCVGPDHAHSNYRMAKETLLSLVPIDPARVHRIEGERDPAQAALAYEAVLRAWWAGAGTPRLDLVLLGMGPDGHTASLFPHSRALAEQTRLVVENHVEAPEAWRVTLTRPVLDAAHLVMPMITGRDKAPVFAVVQGAPQVPPDALASAHPILLLHPAGEMVWLVDRAASSGQ